MRNAKVYRQQLPSQQGIISSACRGQTCWRWSKWHLRPVRKAVTITRQKSWRKYYHFRMAGSIDYPQEKEVMLKVKLLPLVRTTMKWRWNNQPKSGKSKIYKSKQPCNNKKVGRNNDWMEKPRLRQKCTLSIFLGHLLVQHMIQCLWCEGRVHKMCSQHEEIAVSSANALCELVLILKDYK